MNTTERLGAPPAGTVIDVSNVAELEIGDKIHITFPMFSLGRMAYGAETVLTVTGKTAANEVVLADPTGKTMPPLGGSKADLLKMLSDQTSYDAVTVIRPPEVVERMNAERAAKGLPVWQGPMLPPEPAAPVIAAAVGIPWIPILIALGLAGGIGTVIYLRKKE